MALKIRLKRRGRKKLALFDIVIADSKAPRDGKFVEKVGTYNPNSDPAAINMDEDRALHWVMNGAQPTDTVRAMLSYRGILLKKHLQFGVRKGALSQEEADKRFDVWRTEKDKQIADKVAGLEKKKAEEVKTKLAAEAKVKEARAEAAKKKAEEALAAAEAEEKANQEQVAEETETPQPEAAQEAPETGEKEETTAEETKEEATKEEKPAEDKKEKEEASEAKVETAKEEAKTEKVKEEKKEEKEAPADQEKAEKEDKKEEEAKENDKD